mmetsp:Transcript_24204/g.53882  ORF Transcript_24204/g.53882 Transcript_24204/m.53882 type:complete len:91 (+) Transcript_24204:809-1081(+)
MLANRSFAELLSVWDNFMYVTKPTNNAAAVSMTPTRALSRPILFATGSMAVSAGNSPAVSASVFATDAALGLSLQPLLYCTLCLMMLLLR